VIILKQCRIRNWDGSKITPFNQIHDRIKLKLDYLKLVQSELQNKNINRRFHDEPRRIINDLIRWCHGAMGMYAGNNSGCLYLENNLQASNSTVEHVIPVSELVDMYFNKNICLPLLLFFPVAKISKTSNDLLRQIPKTNANHDFPFRRYRKAKIKSKIFTHTGIEVDLERYTIKHHFDLVRETASDKTNAFNEDFAQIYKSFDIDAKLADMLSTW